MAAIIGPVVAWGRALPWIPMSYAALGGLGLGAYVGAQADDAVEGFSQKVDTAGILLMVALGAGAVFLLKKAAK